MKLTWNNLYWGIWVPLKRWEPFYWLRTHTINRYHLVDCRSPQNGYNWGWCDISERILYASMNMLVDFVEKEKAFDFLNWDFDECHQQAAKEIKEIYYWWKSGRKQEHDAANKFADDHKVYNEDDCGYFKENFFKELQPGETGYNSKEKLYSWNPPEPTPEAKKNREIWGKLEDDLEAKDQEMLEKLIKLRRYLWT